MSHIEELRISQIRRFAEEAQNKIKEFKSFLSEFPEVDNERTLKEYKVNVYCSFTERVFETLKYTPQEIELQKLGKQASHILSEINRIQNTFMPQNSVGLITEQTQKLKEVYAKIEETKKKIQGLSL